MYLVTDPHERLVPPITEWVVTGCDINKDITVADILQLSAINIQLKEANRVFRLYIKSLGDRAVYRVEESLKLRSCLIDILHTINPSNPKDIQGALRADGPTPTGRQESSVSQKTSSGSEPANKKKDITNTSSLDNAGVLDHV
ncbi:MAG: hypothetical protein WAK17_04105 [Candidatus Nitrosopolaris sp.]